MSRPIHHTFAPLADASYTWAALSMILGGQHSSDISLKNALEDKFGGTASLFASGREALLALLRAPQFAKGDEVIVQGYTCVVVPNAIRAAGLVPVYCDIEKSTLSLDPEAVEKAVTSKTKAVICQHTFGIPAPMEALRELCDRHHLLLIEDCAHALPDNAGPADIGRFGDAFLLSFGRDKAISGIAGGAMVVQGKMNSDYQLPPLADALRYEEHRAIPLSRYTTFRLLLYPTLYALARPLYGSGIGKAFLALCRKLHLLVPIVTKEEKYGHQPSTLHKMPQACAALALRQWERLQKINDHRRKLTRLYLHACAEYGWPVLHGIRTDLPLQKFPLFVHNADQIRKKLKKQNIHLADGWTGCVVCPADVRIEEVGYRKGSDPEAEKVCEEILTLPTHPGMTDADAQHLIAALSRFLPAASQS